MDKMNYILVLIKCFENSTTWRNYKSFNNNLFMPYEKGYQKYRPNDASI